jgi:hypothetical protein
MHGVLLAALLAGSAQAGDARVEITLLPTRVDGVSTASAARLDAKLAASVGALPAFQLVDLGDEARDALAADPACRDLHSCLGPMLPTDTTLTLDPRLELRGGLLVLDLHLEHDGRMVRRHSSALRSSQLQAAVDRELPLLVAGWSADARLYSRALEGDTEAAEALRRHFPGSGWLQALEQERER